VLPKKWYYLLLPSINTHYNILLAFKRHTNESHQQLGVRYVKITSKAKHKDFIKKEGAYFTQLSRLPYFDLVCGIVIDPMHNLILGEPATLVTPCMLMTMQHD